MEALPGFALLPNPEGCVWGIDPSSKRVALAVLSPGPELDITTVVFSAEIRLRSLSFNDARDRQVRRFRERIESGQRPAVIYIEEPFLPRDRREVPTHLLMYGVTLEALGEACGATPVVEINPSSWKAKALGQGRGHAEKPEIFQWAQSLGYQGRSQDEADAIGVCVAGAVMQSLKQSWAA